MTLDNEVSQRCLCATEQKENWRVSSRRRLASLEKTFGDAQKANAWKEKKEKRRCKNVDREKLAWRKGKSLRCFERYGSWQRLLEKSTVYLETFIFAKKERKKKEREGRRGKLTVVDRVTRGA